MRIFIQEEKDKRPIRLIIPLWLLGSSFILRMIFKATKLTNITVREAKLLAKELKEAKKRFPKLELVRVEEKNGGKVIIRL